MKRFFLFSQKFFNNFKSSNTPKIIALGLLYQFNQQYKNWNIVHAENSDRFDSKLQEQFKRKIPELDNFFDNVILFTGNANPELSQEIAKILGIQLGACTVGRFTDGEVNIQINESVRGKDVYLIQPTCAPVNENLMELLLLVATLRRASARRINVLVPYYGYSRQDRKTSARVPISAADVARLLEIVGVDRVISIDLHCGQIQGFFGPRVPVDNLEANLVALNYFVQQTDLTLNNIVVVSPDAGGVARAKKFQEILNKKANNECTLAMIIKQREAPGKIAQMNLVGSVEGKNAIIIDDMIDTAGTLCEAAKTLKEFGAKSVSCFATHGLFSGNALNNIKNSKLEKIIVTNTTPKKPGEEEIDKITRLSVAPILAETIYRVQKKQSIADLFNRTNIK
ncbi:phosphoribosylpyrophosphate synthetase, putative [Ichthyophthirius multifiliis]|uniref:Ribose-phosphate pyrophosphokinase 2 n=1 Tax=Ichthyophthirius multifiliis TaxID=5932 RepID=G0R610_ICHMU|nr:phosphoribosylpyrophosphate synthetase, putative [Ichthyophthirius multifiliis]EGR27076.1 phosphoribosylpyrophosphate synthetase, putative [Ichthyophthirius multifiliis]|eukprot:XP_004023960.1 phosphoribosylpyrophosphate synthetase, putative [Ichthyophthirius multifiliis]